MISDVLCETCAGSGAENARGVRGVYNSGLGFINVTFAFPIQSLPTPAAREPILGGHASSLPNTSSQPTPWLQRSSVRSQGP